MGSCWHLGYLKSRYLPYFSSLSSTKNLHYQIKTVAFMTAISFISRSIWTIERGCLLPAGYEIQVSSSVFNSSHPAFWSLSAKYFGNNDSAYFQLQSDCSIPVSSILTMILSWNSSLCGPCLDFCTLIGSVIDCVGSLHNYCVLLSRGKSVSVVFTSTYLLMQALCTLHAWQNMWPRSN